MVDPFLSGAASSPSHTHVVGGSSQDHVVTIDLPKDSCTKSPHLNEMGASDIENADDMITTLMEALHQLVVIQMLVIQGLIFDSIPIFEALNDVDD